MAVKICACYFSWMIVEEKHAGYILLRGMIQKGSGRILAKPRKLTALSAALDEIVGNDWTVEDAKRKLLEVLSTGETSRSRDALFEFRKNLFDQTIQSDISLGVLQLICKIIAPLTNSAIEDIPTGEHLAAAKQFAQKELDQHGDSAIETVISKWDEYTYLSCLTAENEIGAKLHANLVDDFFKYGGNLPKEVLQCLLMGALQEFERRAGQKRKGRSGEDLQQAVEVIMHYLGVRLDPVPQLITGILEADHVIRHGRHTCIVSCKRTGRERVKQVSVEREELTKNRIRHIIWFFTHFDQSANRIEDLGLRGSVFYLPDSSNEYMEFSQNPATSKYVLPISGIRSSLPKVLKGETW